ncbi:signal peptide peptidase-like 2B isoform X1 [Lytechinus pictus]|uniref:signal peptide peptidase-like 2B isoform X1 n=1 Tax=Lytechinus pictus TaxID=7653 RepID=UPI0030B9D906
MNFSLIRGAMLTHEIPIEAYYGIVSVQYDNGQGSREYCIMYDPSQYKLPTKLEQAPYKPLADLTPSVLCSDTKLSSLEGHVAAVMRGNCTFTEKGLHAQQAKAEGVLVVSETGVTTPSLNESIQIDIPIVLLDKKDFQDLLIQGSSPEVALYSPQPPQWDYNMIVIWLMATGTLAIGGFWAGLMGYKQHKREKRHERRDGQGRYQNVNNGESSESDEEESEETEAVTITPPIVICWVLMIMVLLLLLFFFYSPVVYVVIALYCIGAWSGMHTTLLPVVNFAIPCKERLPLIPVFQKRPTVTSAILWLGCGAFVLTWFFYRKESFAWILLDILGICFCISVLKVVRLPNFKTCVLLLSLLFVYDVFFVFITPHFTKTGESVMVKVATGGESASEQIPVLLTVPRLCHSVFSVCNVYSMLGFGDILVPGLLVGFCHTYDLKVKSPRIYYITSVIAYGVGLIITFIALTLMQTGQPALLYLVPCTVLSTLAVAVCRKEVSELWNGGPRVRQETDSHTPSSATLQSTDGEQVNEAFSEDTPSPPNPQSQDHVEK